MSFLDAITWIFGAALLLGFVYIVWSYAKGLKGCPRDLYLLYFSKILEYSAYGGMNMAFVLFLHKDCGLSDIAAGSYIGVWSVGLTIVTMMVGAVVDAIGIRRTLIMGAVVLLFARFCMPLTHNIYLVSIIGFVPMAVGIAIMGPVLSVGIKRFTTREQAALGFGLFYTLMNVGWALGGLIFDWVRRGFGEHGMHTLPGLGIELSTYQIIFVVGFAITIPEFISILLIREGVEMMDDGRVVLKPTKIMQEGGILSATLKTAKTAGIDTINIFKEVISHKAFWVFMFMLGILVPVRLVFYHFHYTFPPYGIRLLGEGVKIGNIYGVLNPMMIVFLVPFIAALTKKISSYRIMILGTILSASSVFIATLPAEIFAPLTHTWVGELVFVRWLEVPEELRNPVFFSLIFFIIVFTIGEAFWSPRLMQFTADIAPKGKEGSYIALSYLPYFAAKLFVGPMSGWLVSTYTPEGAESYPNHYMVWVWIGAIATLSPFGLLVFRKLFNKAEEDKAKAAI